MFLGLHLFACENLLDDVLIEEYVREGFPVITIATLMGRNEGAISSRIKKLGLK